MKMNKEDIQTNEEVIKQTLDILICEKRFEMGGFCLSNLTVEKVRDLMENTLLYSLHTLIPAENVKEKTYKFNVKYPCNWKQAFKEQHFPIWLKKWYPVEYKEVTKTVKFTAYNIYPKFPTWYPERCIDAKQIIDVAIPYNEGEEEK